MNSLVLGSGYDTLTELEMITGDHGNKKIQPFKEISEKELELFAMLLKDPENKDNIDNNSVKLGEEYNFSEIFGIEYMDEKFEGFDDETKNILYKETVKNKQQIIDGFVLLNS